MMGRIARPLVFALGLAIVLAAPAASARKNQLNVFIWSEYIDPEIVKTFSERYDCDVILDLYEDNESMLAKLQGGGDSLYDIVVASDFVVPVLRHLKLLAELRHENIPSLGNLEPAFRDPPFDPGNRYTVGYQWGTVGIYMRGDPSTVERTWGLIFDAKKQPGPFLMMDSMREMMGAALRYQGADMNSVSIPELKRARDLLLAAKERSQGFEGGVGAKNKVLAKVVTASVVYNGDAVRGTDDDPGTFFFVPREGGEIWMDSMAVPAHAPHRDMAEKFIEHILDPKIGAALSNFNRYATPNKAARPFITEKDAANPAIYPSDETMRSLGFLKDIGIDIRLYDEAWIQVKSK